MSSTQRTGGRVADYDYELPPDRIARYPSDRRDHSRLLVVRCDRPGLEDRLFSDLPDLFEPGDLLVVNESRVQPVRLKGRKPTGAPAEVLLIRPRDDGRWEALVRPGSKLKPGRTVQVAEDLSVQIEDSIPGGGRLVSLRTPLTVEEALDRYGHVPLPPYLGRDDEPIDRERYQTVYARVAGSVAAPTAGLHFTDDLLDRLSKKGVVVAPLVLHVGIGTFRPVEADDAADHEMHREDYHVPKETALLVERTRAAGGHVWAVGTTVVRVLEAASDPEGSVRSGPDSTDLFIRPPDPVRSVDRLITNFHLPRSTLLMLVAAFAGYPRIMEAYAHAIREEYRFYSYGDAMVILR